MTRRARRPWLPFPALLAVLLALTASLGASTAAQASSTAHTSNLVPTKCARYTGPHPTIGYGSAGKPVFHAQCLLVYQFNQKIRQDGIFGPNTRQAVINAQTWCRALGRKIVVDGIVGPVTWGILHNGC